MLANVNRDLLLYLLIAVPVTGAAIILFGTVWSIIKACKQNDFSKTKVIVASVISIIVACASWILNFGWIRFIMTLMLAPFIHSIIFFVASLVNAKYCAQSKNMKLFNKLFCFSYLATYLFLPDGGDIGGMYVFFGLIHNDFISNTCYSISFIAFGMNILLFILQIKEIKNIKKLQKAIEDDSIVSGQHL